MSALTVAVIVELYLRGVLSEDLNVDLVPRIVVRRAGVGEERGHNAVILDRLHRGLVVAVMIELIRAEFAAGIVSLVAVVSVAGPVLINAQLQQIVLDLCIALVPPAIEHGAVRPAVRCEEVARLTCGEIRDHRRIGIHTAARLRIVRLLRLIGLLGIIRLLGLAALGKGHPLIACGQRCLAVVDLEPFDGIVLRIAVADARPCIHHDLARCLRHIAFHAADFLAVHIPCDLIGLPVKAVGVECLGGIKAEVDHPLMAALTVAVIVDLHFGRILAEDLNVDLVPRILLTVDHIGGAGVGEERGHNAVILDCLHRAFVVAVVIKLIRAVFAAGIVSLVGIVSVTAPVLVDRQIHIAVLDAGISLIPPVVKDRAVRPAVGGEEIACIAGAEIGIHRCGQLRLGAEILNAGGRCGLLGLFRLLRIQNILLDNRKVSGVNAVILVGVRLCGDAALAEQCIAQHGCIRIIQSAVIVCVTADACTCSRRAEADSEHQRGCSGHNAEMFLHDKSSLFHCRFK